MNDPIRVTHKDITITYYEDSDTWESVHGSAKSLSQAKAKIDAFLRKERSFPPFPAFTLNAWGVTEEVTVTSIDQNGVPWIKNSQGRREKCTRILYSTSPNNVDLITKIVFFNNEIKSLKAKIQSYVDSLEKAEVPKEEGLPL